MLLQMLSLNHCHHVFMTHGDPLQRCLYVEQTHPKVYHIRSCQAAAITHQSSGTALTGMGRCMRCSCTGSPMGAGCPSPVYC